MRWLAGLIALWIVSAARPVAATSCRRSIEETFELRLSGVYVGKQKVKPPPELDSFDTLDGTEQGMGLLLSHSALDHDLRFYTLDRPLPPTPTVMDYLRAVEKLHSSGGLCGPLPYRAVLPGRYRFTVDEHDRTRSRRISDPVVIVPPGRDHVELRFRVGQRRYRAVYRVRCAYFETYRVERRQCALTEKSPGLAALLAAAMAAPPIDEDADYDGILDSFDPPPPDETPAPAD